MTPYLRLVRNTIAAHPDHASLLAAAGYLFRRFDLAEAAGYATRADQLAPYHASASGLGLIYRDLGLTSEALDAFERALSYEPDNLEVYADICDLLMNADRLDEALTYARRALAIDPGHICSQIAALAVRFRQFRNAADLDALMELCRAQPADTIAARGLATGAEVDALDAAARRHLADPGTLTVPVTYFLAWARKPVAEPRP